MNPMNDRSALLHRIQAEDFALYEVALYLDAHPHCQRALRYFEEHQKIAAEMKAAYVTRFGPLTLHDACAPERWQWTEGPWPWEKEGN